MELLSQYCSNSASSSDSQSDHECCEEKLHLTPQQVRSVYLLTYSQADLSIFPDRESFASAVCEAVSKCEGPKAKIIQWTCCQESHKKGGKHYHMAIKLNKIKRWLPIRHFLKASGMLIFISQTVTSTTTVLGCTQRKKTKTFFSLLATLI